MNRGQITEAVVGISIVLLLVGTAAWWVIIGSARSDYRFCKEEFIATHEDFDNVEAQAFDACRDWIT